MTTTPPPSATLSQTPPLDPRHAIEHIETRRQQMLDRLDDIDRRLAEATDRHDQAAERATQEVTQLRERIPDVGEQPTEVEWLTRRAAQADGDLAASRHQVTTQELWIERQQLNFQSHELSWQIAQLDDLLETGLYAAGNEAQLAVMALDLQEVAADLVNERGITEISRQRLVHAKRMHREIQTALRKARRAEESGQKR